MKKQNIKSIAEQTNQLDQITDQIITYEPGDIMDVIDIAESIDKLAGICTGSDREKIICKKLQEAAKDGMADSFGPFTRILTEGVDLLRTVVESGSQIPAGKQKQIDEWLAGKLMAPPVMKQAEQKPEQQSSPVTPPAAPAEDDEDPSQIDSDQLKLFLSDCDGRFSTAQDLILKLEQTPGDSETINELFRVFHTVKGECGFLKLNKLGNLSHTIESLLDQLRSNKRSVDSSVIDMLLKGLDVAQLLAGYLENESFSDYKNAETEQYKAQLKAFTEGTAVSVAAAAAAPAAAAPVQAGASSAAAAAPAKNEPHAAAKKADTADTVIKVKTGKINYLVDMIGELLIGLGQMKDDTKGLSQVRKIARTLQYAGMQLRTESVHTLFGTVRRIIRDTSQKVGKEVETVFEGEELEIDRTLIESLEEPLMHLVRNAIDHGIESCEERIAAGKKEHGTIRIAAERRGNNIVISVGDDGQGLDRKKILKKAVDRKLIRESDCDAMSDTAINNLIFESGFSTNESVNLISGRGVGMGIVKEAVMQAKGHIITESVQGKGTTFSLFFPLSTAIIDGMMTRTGNNTFIIPITSIIESLKIKPELVHKVTDGVNVLDLRGRMIPIIKIADVLDITDAGSGEIATVVESETGELYAIMSDQILAKREVVIKNLGPYLSAIRGISSGTVLSGGTVGFVLDIDQIIALGKESSSKQRGGRYA